MASITGPTGAFANEVEEVSVESELEGNDFKIWLKNGPPVGDFSSEFWEPGEALLRQVPGLDTCQFKFIAVRALNSEESVLHVAAETVEGHPFWRGALVVAFKGDNVVSASGKLDACSSRPMDALETENMLELGLRGDEVYYDQGRDSFVFETKEVSSKTTYELKDLAIVSHSESTGDAPKIAARMSHFSYPNSSLQHNNGQTTSGLMPKVETGYTDPCRAQLQLPSYIRGFNRIQDPHNGELYEDHVCHISPTFNVPWTSDREFNQTQVHFYTYVSFLWASHHVWSEVSPSSSTDVSIEVNSTSDPCPTSGACFFSWPWPQIYYENTQTWNAETIAHEYGHFVNSTYGGFTEDCTEGADEGDSLEETTAGIFAAIALWDHMPNLRYDATMTNGVKDKHITGAGVDYDQDCVGLDSYEYGQFFRSAVWEFMWNRNCSTYSCSGSMAWSTSGPDNGFINAAQAREATAEALAYAISVTPTATSFNAIKSHMYTKLLGISGATVASSFNTIMSHHGL